MEQLQVGRARLTWLNGGVNFLDGGTMFGVVPSALWKRYYPYEEKTNLIELRTDPILLQLDGKNYLIDAGIGNGKLTDKQKRNFGVREESFIEQSLEKLNLGITDIDCILMTHMDFDHACGLTKLVDNTYESVFPNVPIYTSKIEWHEMRHPNIRSINTYWEMNWQPIVDQVKTFEEEIEIAEGLKLIYTGGHSTGHSIIVFEDGDESFIHMADLMPTNAHQNKLWVLAYDDYPITSVYEKEKWMDYGYETQAWFTFYHDAYYRAIKYDKAGKRIAELRRKQHEYNDNIKK